MTVVLYGVGIHQAIARGDLEEMRSLLQQADEHLKTYGNVSAAAEVLRAEIAKAEGRATSS